MNSKEKNIEYIETIYKIASEFWADFYGKLKSVDLINLHLLKLELLIPVDQETMVKFGLGKPGVEFKLIVNNNGEASIIEPCYYTIKIKPEGFWSLPDDYEEVGMLDILQEAVKQNRYNPDIKHLQSKTYRESDEYKKMIEKIKMMEYLLELKD